MVVNSLQIVSLKYWKQYRYARWCLLWRCEFLTNCIFEVLKTVPEDTDKARSWLWIPYKLYLWSIENSIVRILSAITLVVNSLQIVSLKYWKQYEQQKYGLTMSCEFLTNCIFEVLKTVNSRNTIIVKALWIPYKLYLWSIENSFECVRRTRAIVVNSLQIVSLKYWKQLPRAGLRLIRCCEFLTNCIFEVLKTVHH